MLNPSNIYMDCIEFEKLMSELIKAIELLEEKELYTPAFIITAKLVFAKVDYELCMKGYLVKNHKDRFETLKEYTYDEKFKNLYECYNKIYKRYRRAYIKILSKEEYKYYKELLEKCLK